MSGPETEISEIPERCTDQMVTMLFGVLHDALDKVHEGISFSRGDVMAAAMHLIVETGLEAASPEMLREDVINGFDLTLADQLSHRETRQ